MLTKVGFFEPTLLIKTVSNRSDSVETARQITVGLCPNKIFGN
jgi:hypothetical protein